MPEITPSAADTKERLLDAAERLYADGGIEGTSLRAITRTAGANLAAVNYHFGSKDGLTEAVFSRRLLPINTERLEWLDRLEAEADGAAVPVESILDAFLQPALQHSRDANFSDFLRLMGRMYTEAHGALGPILARQFSVVLGRFITALSRALPDLAAPEVHWRFHFMVGSMVHVVTDPVRLKEVSGGLCDPSDITGTIARIKQFLCAGLRAPATPLDSGESSES